MTSQPPPNRELAFRNMMRKIITTLWKGQLYNAARTHAGQPPGKKASYIQIAHDDLQRLDLFKPSQLLGIPHNQLRKKKCESFRGTGLRGQRPERAMNRMDRPRTSIDERMLSGRRAVVIVSWAVAGFWSFFIDLLLLVAATFCILGLDFCVLASWGSAALLLFL